MDGDLESLVERDLATPSTTALARLSETLAVPDMLAPSGDAYVLRVRGDSMIDAQIAENDYVVVREQPDAQNGDIVAALVPGTEDGATVKHFSRNGDRVRLLPANKQYRPILFGSDGRILGKVVTVLRRI